MNIKRIREVASSLGVALFFALLIRAFVAQAFSIPSGSMEPTLQVHDMLIANRIIFRLRSLKPEFMPDNQSCRDRTTGQKHIVCRGEVVIFIAEHTMLPRDKMSFYLFSVPYPAFLREACKRTACKKICPSCIWMWKDFIKRVIGLPNEVIEVKDGFVWINGKRLEEDYIKEPPDYEYGPRKIGPDEIFVMGDNRNNSEDSHIWGTLKLKFLRGKALFIYWPFTRTDFIQ